MRTVTVFVFVVFAGVVICQNNYSRKDTVISGIRYNVAQFYDGSAIKILGNKIIQNDSTSRYYKDTVRTGSWIYFSRKGKIIAKGNFENDKKTGTWVYTSGRKKVRKWARVYSRKEELEIEKGELVIYDFEADCVHCGYRVYRNGKYLKQLDGWH